MYSLKERVRNILTILGLAPCKACGFIKVRCRCPVQSLKDIQFDSETKIVNTQPFVWWSDAPDRVYEAVHNQTSLGSDVSDQYLSSVEIPGGIPLYIRWFDSFQHRVQCWMIACFGRVVSLDKWERNNRFLEEALELVQSLNMPKHVVLQIVDYVYSRPRGEPEQELGGVMVTLAALSTAKNMDMNKCAEVELQRVWGKIEVIRAKQAAKPKFQNHD